MARTAGFAFAVGLLFAWNWSRLEEPSTGVGPMLLMIVLGVLPALLPSLRWRLAGASLAAAPRRGERARRCAALVDRQDRGPRGEGLPRLLRRARPLRRSRAPAHARCDPARSLRLHRARRPGDRGQKARARRPRRRRGSRLARDDHAGRRRPRPRRLRAGGGARARRLASARGPHALLLRSWSASGSSSLRSSSRARARSLRASSSAGRTGTSTTSLASRLRSGTSGARTTTASTSRRSGRASLP